MQVRVHPRTRLVLHLLRDVVRSLPVAMGVVPERSQWLAQTRRWRRVAERGSHLVDRHRVGSFTIESSSRVSLAPDPSGDVAMIRRPRPFHSAPSRLARRRLLIAVAFVAAFLSTVIVARRV